MNTLKTLQITFTYLCAVAFTYLCGHVVMSLLFYYELTDFANISKDMDTILHFVFGLPILYAQIRIVKYVQTFRNELI